MRTRLSGALCALAMATAACGVGADVSGDESVAQVSAALDQSTSRVPIPLRSADGKTNGWDRSLVDLMVADTWATCSFLQGRDAPINHKLVGAGDEYLDKLLLQMQSTMSGWIAAKSPPASSTQQQWIDFRNEATFNRNRSTGELAGAGLARRNFTSYTLSLSDPRFSAAQAQASESVALAAMNACIAQGVRSLSLGGDMLVLSEPEQIQALEVTRERAQIASLQYAALFNGLATATPFSATASATTYQSIAFLQKWAATEPARATYFQAWINDFTGTVQLHLTATTELADLFTRSAASKSPRGGRAQSAAEEEWGAGSWRQRLLALLYGGDPLAVDGDGSTPWTNMVGRTAPGVTLAAAVRAADPWPSRDDLPFSTIDNRDPRVVELLALARRMDALRVKNNADNTADLDATADRLYRAVEARLRSDQCATVQNGACTTYTEKDITSLLGSSGPTPIDSYTLFRTYGITRDHALTAAQILAERLPMTGVPPVNVVGSLALSTDASGTWRYEPRDTSESARTLAQIAPLFERYSPYRMPVVVDPNVERSHVETTPGGTSFRVGDDQGLAAGGIYAESMRVLGAVPALSTLRDAIRRVRASATAPAELVTALGNVGDPLTGTIDAAIGARSLRISPIENIAPYDWANSDPSLAGARMVTERLQATKKTRTPPIKVFAGWSVDADVSADDAFFQPDSSAVFEIVAVRNEPQAYALGIGQTARRLTDGKGITDLAVASDNVVIAPASIQNGKLTAELYLQSEFLSSTAAPTWTLLARRTAGTTLVGYRPLTGAVPVYTWQFNRVATGRVGELAPVLSYSFADGGRLGRTAVRAWTVQRSNPSRPAYDGFGLPYTWVPSADATAFGSQQGDSVMTYFLRNAKQAASDATEAVRVAIDSTYKLQSASLEQQAARSRSDLVLRQERDKLCGASWGGRDCTPVSTRINLSTTWTPMADVWVGVADPAAYCRTNGATEKDAKRRLDCTTYAIASRASSLPVAKIVRDALNDSGAPTFSAYSGGQLQQSLIEQWSALRRLSDTLSEIENIKRGAAARLTAAQSTINQMDSLASAADQQLQGLTAEQQHSKDKLKFATQAAHAQCLAVYDTLNSMGWIEWSGVKEKWSGGTVDQDTLENGTIDEIEGRIAGGSHEGGGWEHLRGAEAGCAQARVALEEARTEADRLGVMQLVMQSQADAAKWATEAARGTALAEGFEAIASILREGTTIDSALADLAKTIAEGAQMRQDVALAKQREDLETKIAAQTYQLSSGLFRQYQQFDWWRARALLDGARRYAVAAKRAIETQYVVDLNELSSPEPFVAPPSAWSEDVYRYDLSLPSAVGLSAGPAPASGSSYPNQVLDYVGNLERFVQGFAVERPMSAANDAEVITIPGPGANLVVAGQVVADPLRAAWSALCPAASKCTSPGAPAWCEASAGGLLSRACESTTPNGDGTAKYLPPNQARVTFALDPWGQVVLREAMVHFDQRVNARWGKLAINLVGNGIHDCANAQNPNDCQSKQYLRYTLTHSGPTLAIGASKQWRLLDIPVAFVEQAKAPTLGEFLDVEQNGWGKPFVEAVAREELAGRPMGGVYVVELDGGAGVSFDRIEALQLLTSSSYWVVQR